MNLKQLNQQYELLCNEWIHRFAKKQDIDFDYWIGDEVGGIASFACQYYFNLSDIILDLMTKQPKGKILDWQTDNVEVALEKMINYKSYTMGLRCDKG